MLTFVTIIQTAKCMDVCCNKAVRKVCRYLFCTSKVIFWLERIRMEIHFYKMKRI